MPPDPETYVNAASSFATFVGLLATWKQERGASTQNKKDDFMVWLAEHHFDALRLRILESEELQRELNSLLQGSVESLSSKLDQITGIVVAFSSKLEGFDRVARTMHALSPTLSLQACKILKWLSDTESSGMMIVHSPSANGFDKLLDAGGPKPVYFADQRFILDDLDELCRFNLIKKRFTSRMEIYELTRQGHSLALELPPVTITPKGGISQVN